MRGESLRGKGAGADAGCGEGAGTVWAGRRHGRDTVLLAWCSLGSRYGFAMVYAPLVWRAPLGAAGMMAPHN
jgi:hypothetical protein